MNYHHGLDLEWDYPHPVDVDEPEPENCISGEPWYLASTRVLNDPALLGYCTLLLNALDYMSDDEKDAHLEFLITAPTLELIAWAAGSGGARIIAMIEAHEQAWGF